MIRRVCGKIRMVELKVPELVRQMWEDRKLEDEAALRALRRGPSRSTAAAVREAQRCFERKIVRVKC